MEKTKITDLVIKSKNGDKAALNSLVNEIYNDIYYYILKTVKDENLAADITQESCIEIITSIDKLQSPEAFSVWSKRIAFHQCTRYFRKTKDVLVDENEDGETIFDELVDESEDALPEQVLEDKEFRKTIMDMINSLTPEQSNALLLYYYEKMSIKQIAEIQDTTEGTIKSRLNYARKAIKGKVEEYEERTGTKLHSIAILPLLLGFVFGSEKSTIPTLSVPTAVTASVGTTVAGTTATASIGTTATAVATKGAGTALATKIIAGAVAASLVIGGTVFGISKFFGDSSNEDNIIVSENESANDNYISKGNNNSTDNNNNEETIIASLGLEFVPYDNGYGVASIGECKDSKIVIPKTYNKQPVVAIMSNAFEKTEITSIVIPNSVTTIKYDAFSECLSLKKVAISEGVKEINESAFARCTALEEVILPDSITYIGPYAFKRCESLKEIVIPSGVTTIVQNCFAECSNLEKVTLPNGVTEISRAAFWKCYSLKEINIPDSVTMIDGVAFYECRSLEMLKLPDSVSQIVGFAFQRCSALVEIEIPAGITILDKGVFEECSALKKISIPNTVTEISRNLFYECISLTDIKFNGTKSQWESIVFYNKAPNRHTLKYPWNYGCGEITVHCTDGDISIAENN